MVFVGVPPPPSTSKAPRGDSEAWSVVRAAGRWPRGQPEDRTCLRSSCLWGVSGLPVPA